MNRVSATRETKSANQRLQYTMQAQDRIPAADVTANTSVPAIMSSSCLCVEGKVVIICRRVDRFGRIRKDSNQSYSRSRSRSGSRPRGRPGRTFSSSRSRSRSGSRSSSASSRSISRGRSISRSRSRSRSSFSRSSSASSVGSRRRGEKRRMTQGTVSYGQAKSKAMDPMKLSGQKQQIKLTLKGSAMRRLDKPVLPQEDDSGESDTDGKVIRKRKPDSPPQSHRHRK
nr:zinc finger Ran-binding domain-containing protein 2-like [Penaeus vannamei]